MPTPAEPNTEATPIQPRALSGPFPDSWRLDEPHGREQPFARHATLNGCGRKENADLSRPVAVVVLCVRSVSPGLGGNRPGVVVVSVGSGDGSVRWAWAHGSVACRRVAVGAQGVEVTAEVAAPELLPEPHRGARRLRDTSSDGDRAEALPSAAGPPVARFGTPVGRFGTRVATIGPINAECPLWSG